MLMGAKTILARVSDLHCNYSLKKNWQLVEKFYDMYQIEGIYSSGLGLDMITIFFKENEKLKSVTGYSVDLNGNCEEIIRCLKGYYWNEIDLQRCFDGKTRDVPVEKYVKEIKKIVQDWFKNCWIGCFTEDMNNFPLWYYYADKYTGFCVEYDFSCLPQHNLFQQRLQPVIYLKHKFNLTLSLEAVCDPEKVINNEPVPSYWLHIIGNLIKNESWEFEKEWRYVSYDGITKEGGKEVNLPVKPMHIYCGKDMAKENYEVMLKGAESLGCECSKIGLNSFEDREFIVC